MTRPATLAAALVLAIASTTAAEAGWKRNSTTVGPNGGVWSSTGSGSCSGGSCASNQTWTGPGGNTVTRNGSTSCANGSCSGTATYTGPGGRTVTRNRSITRN